MISFSKRKQQQQKPADSLRDYWSYTALAIFQLKNIEEIHLYMTVTCHQNLSRMLAREAIPVLKEFVPKFLVLLEVAIVGGF